MELLGPEEPPEVVDDATLYILKLLFDETKASVQHVTDMRRIFGILCQQSANSLFEVKVFLVTLIQKISNCSFISLLKICGIP